MSKRKAVFLSVVVVALVCAAQAIGVYWGTWHGMCCAIRLANDAASITQYDVDACTPYGWRFCETREHALARLGPAT